MGWCFEQPLVQWMATKTHRPLPGVTGVILPCNQGVLFPQDVALTLRAIVGFHPRVILIGEPLAPLSTAPLSLMKEAQETGMLQGVPLFFAALKTGSASARVTSWFSAPVFLLPEKTILPKISGEGGPSSFLGFINDGTMPLLAQTLDGSCVASLWWRGLFSSEKKMLPQDAAAVLLGGRSLMLSNNRVLWLDSQTALPSALGQHATVVALDDVLLHREEMERGQIRPDLDALFRDQMVLLGGQAVATQANNLQGAAQQLAVHHLGVNLYGALLFLLSLGMLWALRHSGMDLALIFLGVLFVYLGGGFLLFRFTGILLPLFLPLAILLVAFFKSIIPACTAKREQ